MVALIAVYLSRQWLQLAEFPEEPDLGSPIAAAVSAFTDALVSAVSSFTGALADAVSYGLLNPLQSLLAETPWWLIGVVLIALAYLLGGWRPAVITLSARRSSSAPACGTRR